MQLQGLLEAWLASTDVATFREAFFGQRALFRDAAHERLAPVLALSSWNVREILAQPTSKFIAWLQATDGRHVTAEVSPEAAQRLYQAGITIYIRQVPVLAPMATALATALAVPEHNIECTLFCHQPGAHTRMHFDPVDTLTMQVTGHKRWRIARNLHAPVPTAGYATLDARVTPELRLYAHDPFPTHMPTEAEEYLLTPGSVLYVPRGYWHETESDEASIALHVHHMPVPWVDAVLVTLRAKLLRDPVWRAGAHDLWDASRRSHTAATADRLLDLLTAAVDGLTADDVLATPIACPHGVQPDTPFVRCARAGFSTDTSADERSYSLVTFSVSAYGTERRTTLAMSPLYLVEHPLCFDRP
jgi:50S ribosomal protein L16 3-hydroxylase